MELFRRSANSVFSPVDFHTHDFDTSRLRQNDFVVPHGACFVDDGEIGVFMSGGFERDGVTETVLEEVIQFNFYFDYVKIGERLRDFEFKLV